MWAQRAAILGLLALVGCGEPAVVDESADGSTTPPYVRAESDPSLLANMVQPIRIGELGPSFAACNGRGAIRDRSGAGAVPVRAAPYEQSGQIAALAPGSQFFICSRTNDQRWFGIVYDEGGLASERCAVSAPVPSRRSYQGPCAAGWVASASVRLVSGVPHQLPAAAAQPVAPPTD
jgi:hypothetical protein